MDTTRTLQATLETRAADPETRSVPVTISSSTPIDVGGGVRQILDHSPQSVDLSRAPLPVIESHDRGRVNIGVVDQLRLTGDRLRGVLRMGSQARADELWPDIRDGIVSSLSVGFQVLEDSVQGSIQTVTRWAPFEVSIVSVPADPAAGTYRSSTMTETTPDAPAPAVETHTMSAWEDRELARREAVEGLFRQGDWRSKAPIFSTLYDRAIRDPRMSAETVKAELIAAIALHERSGYGGPHAVPATPAGAGATLYRLPGPYGDDRDSLVPPKEQREYNLGALICRMADPKFNGGGFELEISQELERSQAARHGGVRIPWDIPPGPGYQTRALTAVGGGASLVGLEHRPDLFVDVLRARSVSMAMGAVMLQGLDQSQSIPRKTAPATVAWLNLDDADTIVPADATFDSITMQPHQLAGISVFSHRMLRQGLPETEQVIRDDLAGTVAEGLDRAVLQGSGVGAEPAGLSQLAAHTPTYTGGSLAYTDLLGQRQAVFTASADVNGSLGYVAHPDLLTQLEGTQKFASEGDAIADMALDNGDFQINGVRGMYSANQTTASVTFGAWNRIWVGFWGPGTEILVDPTYEFAKGNVGVRIIADADIAVREGASFSYLTTL